MRNVQLVRSELPWQSPLTPSYLNKPKTILKETVTNIPMQADSTEHQGSSKAGREVLIKIRIRKSEILVYQTIILFISHVCSFKYCSTVIGTGTEPAQSLNR